MRMSLANIKNKRQLESILLVCALVAMSIVIVLPLSAPKAKGQVIHDLPSAMAEDIAGSPYDVGPPGDQIVIWDPTQSHILVNDYDIPPGFTLIIPPLNYTSGQPGELTITVQFPGSKIDVYGNPGNPGKLITNSDFNANTFTAFFGPPFWDGIYFHPNSEGRIYDTYIADAMNGVVFEPGSRLMSPGIYGSYFNVLGAQGLYINGAVNYTNIQQTWFDDTSLVSTSLVVEDCSLNISNMVQFRGHGAGMPSLSISDADVSIVDPVFFFGYNTPGNSVYIEGKSNGTVLSGCEFIEGGADDYYIQVDGSTPLINNCTFDQAGKQLTLLANENSTGVPAHPILRNPNPSIFFDNTTINATGNSSITLQWYPDVYVIDPDGNPIAGSTVTVNGTAPGMPLSMKTETSGPDIGWARDFLTTELILYNNSVTNFNPFNVSADNNTEIGYAIPEPTIDYSKSITVVVPFSLIQNTPPSVFWLETPPGTQGGEITIQYILFDPNPWDNGSLSIMVEFSFDNASWVPATIASGSPPTTNRYNNTLHSVIWDSSFDLMDIYQDPVYLQIIPSDPWGVGPPSATGNFIVDNQPPIIVLPPVLEDVTNTTATINWTVDQPATASLWYGLDDTLTMEASGSSGSPEQSVTLTNLQPGRKYTYVANSTDPYGNTVSTFPLTFVFYTKVYIQLHKGWNMISLPPDIPDMNLDIVLASIAGEYDAVQWYNASDAADPWKHYHIDKSFGNDLGTIDSTMGLWILMKNDAVLKPDQVVPVTGTSMTLRLYEGWNFIGYQSAITRPITTALSGVFYNLVQTYDAGSGKWLSYDQSAYPPEPDDLLVMEMGRGYWIYVTLAGIWSIDYA